MGFFGLFVTVFGIGTVASEKISLEIDNLKRKSKAIEKNQLFYNCNGYQTRSTKTGEQCTIQMDYETMHNWICDSKTGRKIDDITLHNNNEKTKKSKEDMIKNGCKFYKTFKYDYEGMNGSTNIWINDDMPGKYFCRIYNYHHKKNRDEFVEGNLVKCGKDYKVNCDYSIKYLKDGTLIH